MMISLAPRRHLEASTPPTRPGSVEFLRFDSRAGGDLTHCGLLTTPPQDLLDLVVQKSAGYSLEQLERLYALLSQCIYQHRREYDKGRLLEVRRGRCSRRVMRSLIISQSEKEKAQLSFLQPGRHTKSSQRKHGTLAHFIHFNFEST